MVAYLPWGWAPREMCSWCGTPARTKWWCPADPDQKLQLLSAPHPHSKLPLRPLLGPEPWGEKEQVQRPRWTRRSQALSLSSFHWPLENI